jgi:uncharacterized membrane protein
VARQLGGIVGVWLVVISLLFIGPALSNDVRTIGTPGIVLEITFLIVGGICSFVLFRRPSILASSAVFAMTLTEIAFRFLDPASNDLTVPILALLFSAQALRGSIGTRRL